MTAPVASLPAKWPADYCPECASDKVGHREWCHVQCGACGQEYFTDIDYSDVVRENLRRLHALASPAVDGGLRMFADAVERLAFKMPAPNEWTPQFVSLAIEARRLATPEQPGSAVQSEDGVDTINAATLSDAADDPALGLPEARAMLRDASGLIRRLATTAGSVQGEAVACRSCKGAGEQDAALATITCPRCGGEGSAVPRALADLIYFTEHCLSAADEGVDYAVPREWLDAMTTMGLLKKCGRGKWAPTEQAEALRDYTTPPPAPAAVTWHRFEDRMPPSREWVMAKSRLTGKVAPLSVLTDWDAALIERYEGWHEIVAPAAEQGEPKYSWGADGTVLADFTDDPGYWTQPEARGVEGMILVPSHYAENVGYAAAVLEQSECLIDRRNAPALRALMKLLAAAPAAPGAVGVDE